MKETASDQGRPIAEAEVDAIRRDMAQNYIDSLKFQAKNNGGLVTREISHDEAWGFHKDVFLKHGLTVDAWTLNTPFLMMSEDMRAAFWQDTLAAELKSVV